MITKDIAHFIVTIHFHELPPDVVAKAKMCVLDLLGYSLAAHKTKSTNAVRRMVQAMGGRKESTLIGVGVKAPVPLAAWANSVLANALDMDDGSFWPKGHAGHHGAMVIPSSLSIAEAKGLSGKNFIEGIVVGYEVGIRAGYIMSSLGIHQGGTMGCYGLQQLRQSCFVSMLKRRVMLWVLRMPITLSVVPLCSRCGPKLVLEYP